MANVGALQMKRHESSAKFTTRWGFCHRPDIALMSKRKEAVEHAGFMLGGSQELRWSTSTVEYRKRYRNIANRDLGLQMHFLQKLLNVCRQRGIKVVLVNMPLSSTNRSLLPPGFYDSYRKSVAGIAAGPSVTFVDLGDSQDFQDIDFWDTASLNFLGGRKLLTDTLKPVEDQLTYR